MGGCFNFGRCTLHALAIFFIFGGLCLIIAALMIPQWQQIQFQQSQDLHHHGLWQDCTFAYREGSQGTWTCTYKRFNGFDGTLKLDQRADTNRRIDQGHHDNDSWRLICICMLSGSCLLATVALILALISTCSLCGRYVGCYIKFTAVAWLIFEFFAVVLIAAQIIYFVRVANEPDYLTAVEAGQTVRELQSFGISYYLAVIGAGMSLLSFFIGIFSTVMFFMGESGRYSKQHPVCRQQQNDVAINGKSYPAFTTTSSGDSTLRVV